MVNTPVGGGVCWAWDPKKSLRTPPKPLFPTEPSNRRSLPSTSPVEAFEDREEILHTRRARPSGCRPGAWLSEPCSQPPQQTGCGVWEPGSQTRSMVQ